MKIHALHLLLLLMIIFPSCQHKKRQHENYTYSGNPVIPGWYADPEGIILKVNSGFTILKIERLQSINESHPQDSAL
jgi:hypothetical protein